METVELEKQVFDALISNTELMILLPDGAKSIYHYVAPSNLPEKYPVIVYTPISDVPALAGDNCEIAHKVTIRIHVIAPEKRFKTIENKFKRTCRLVNDIMTGLYFIRRQTTPYSEDGKTMLIFDYIKGVES